MFDCRVQRQIIDTLFNNKNIKTYLMIPSIIIYFDLIWLILMSYFFFWSFIERAIVWKLVLLIVCAYIILVLSILKQKIMGLLLMAKTSWSGLKMIDDNSFIRFCWVHSNCLLKLMVPFWCSSWAIISCIHTQNVFITEKEYFFPLLYTRILIQCELFVFCFFQILHAHHILTLKTASCRGFYRIFIPFPYSKSLFRETKLLAGFWGFEQT